MSSAVASVASVSLVAPSIAAPIGGDEAVPDPIFAELDRYLQLDRECDRLADLYHDIDLDAPDYRRAADAVVAARLSLAQTVPTTLAGLAAYARFLNHQSNVVLETSFFDEDMGELLPFYVSLDRSLTAMCPDISSLRSANQSTRIAAPHSADPDATLTRIGAELEKKIAIAIEAMKRHDQAYDAWDRGEISQAQYDQIDRAYDAAYRPIETLWERMSEIRATTIEGLRIKARLAQFHRYRTSGFANMDDELIGTNLIDDLIAGDPTPLALPPARA